MNENSFYVEVQGDHMQISMRVIEKLSNWMYMHKKLAFSKDIQEAGLLNEI